MTTKTKYALLEKARVMIFAAHGWPVEIATESGWAPIQSVWNWYKNNYRIAPNALKVPEGCELVPLGEPVEGPKIVRAVSHGWFYGADDACYANNSPMQFIARKIKKPEPRKVPLERTDYTPGSWRFCDE